MNQGHFLIAKISNLILLMRPYQWYKNLLVFLAIIFSQNLINLEAIVYSLATFWAFCLMSSSNYIINDIFDRKKDAHNPEKKNRPIASGMILVSEALVFSLTLFIIAIVVAMMISYVLIVILILFFLLTFFYSYQVKHLPFIEFFFVALNFVLRAVGGAIGIGVDISLWLMGGTFLLALLVVIGKRKAEFGLNSAVLARKVMKSYSSRKLSAVSIWLGIVIVIAYIVYIFSSPYRQLLVTVPLFIIIIFLYEFHVIKEDRLARHPHLMITDFYLVLVCILMAISLIVLLYPF